MRILVGKAIQIRFSEVSETPTEVRGTIVLAEGTALNSGRHFGGGLGCYCFSGHRFPECVSQNVERVSAH